MRNNDKKTWEACGKKKLARVLSLRNRLPVCRLRSSVVGVPCDVTLPALFENDML